jgi:hypothetical protein
MGSISTFALTVSGYVAAKFKQIEKNADKAQIRELMMRMERRDAELILTPRAPQEDARNSRRELHEKIDQTISTVHATAVKVGQLEGRLSSD